VWNCISIEKKGISNKDNPFKPISENCIRNGKQNGYAVNNRHKLHSISSFIGIYNFFSYRNNFLLGFKFSPSVCYEEEILPPFPSNKK